MQNDSTGTHRTRARSLLAAAIVLVGVLGGAGVAAVAAQPAGAASEVVTYGASVTQPGPLAGNFSQTGNGDGWAVALTSSQVFNVSHHQSTLILACHNQSNASLCWSTATKTITDPQINSGSQNFATPPGAGLYLNQSTGKLYTFATSLATSTAGVVCMDTTKPATDTGAQVFCGFTPLSGAGDAPTFFAQYGTYSGISAPAQVGTNWYALNEAPLSGVSSGTNGTQNTLMCFSLTTFAACSTPRYAVDLGGETLTGFEYASPIAAIGSDIVMPIPGTIASDPVTEMGCFSTTSGSQCAGSWPVAVSSSAGAPFPFLNSTGTVTGVCLPITGNPCYSLTGGVVTTPARMPAAIGATDVLNGPAVVNTTTDRDYVPNWNTNSVDCFNFATDASCTNFPKPFTNLDDLYTVNSDPYRPNCLWVNSDHGTGQIQDFDATSGTTCAPGPIRLNASSAIATSAATCKPVSYNSIQVTSPAHSSYASGTVQFANSEGAIQAIPAQSLNSFGVASLAGLNFSSDPEPQFVITLNGLKVSPANVSVKLSWKAAYATACYSDGQTVSTNPGYWMNAADGTVFHEGIAPFYGPFAPLHPNRPVVGMTALSNHSGYWEVASDGGIFSFGYAQFFGSTGNITLNKPIVGMAATPTGKGYWLVASDGGIFAFGDAKFYGSAGNLVLNKPIVGMAVTPDGGGYWLVASDGGIFSYGDAAFYGSTGNITLNKPIVGMAAYPSGGGYWMVASDGGIFSYGQAAFHGSTGNIKLNKPIVGMATSYDGAGYWLVADDGGIFSFGDASFAGSQGSTTLYAPIVGMTS